MKRILFGLMISFFIIILQLGCSNEAKRTINDDKTVDYTHIENSINELIDKSLKVQYGPDDIALNDVFTDDFINKIPESADFYKKDLAPFKIVDTNLDEIKDGPGDDNVTINVRVNDKKGEYIQVIHFVKKSNQYLIDTIEYDI